MEGRNRKCRISVTENPVVRKADAVYLSVSVSVPLSGSITSSAQLTPQDVSYLFLGSKA